MTTTAKIASKGTNATGLTEDIAKTLHDNLGKTIVAIVEITSEARTEKKSGAEHVQLSIGMLEVAPDGLAADHVRELARSFHYERQLKDGQMAIDDDIEPKVADVLEAGQRFTPHPFLAADPEADNPICEVCGVVDPDRKLPQHLDRTGLDDPFEIPTEPDEPPAA